MTSTAEDEEPATTDRLRRAVRHTRGLVLGQALLVLLLGFTADDLDLLRIPGYLAGSAGAFAVLTFGGLLHGHRLSRRYEDLDPDEEKERLAAHRRRGWWFAGLVTVIFGAWAVFFTAGVPPWAL